MQLIGINELKLRLGPASPIANWSLEEAEAQNEISGYLSPP